MFRFYDLIHYVNLQILYIYFSRKFKLLQFIYFDSNLELVVSSIQIFFLTPEITRYVTKFEEKKYFDRLIGQIDLSIQRWKSSRDRSKRWYVESLEEFQTVEITFHSVMKRRKRRSVNAFLAAHRPPYNYTLYRAAKICCFLRSSASINSPRWLPALLHY